jgi:hypothetical protein
MGSPNLSLSQITLRAFNGKSLQPLGVFTNLHITLRFKIVLIEVEVVDDPLDYNIPLGKNYMYYMRTLLHLSSTLCNFPMPRKVVTIITQGIL